MNVAEITRNAYMQNTPKRVSISGKASFEDELASQQLAAAESVSKADKPAISETTIGDIRELYNDYNGLMKTRDALYQLGIPKESSIEAQLEYMEAQRAFLQKLVDRGMILPEDVENSFIICTHEKIKGMRRKHSNDLLTDLEFVREYEMKLNDRLIKEHDLHLQPMLDHIASLDRLISALTTITRP